MKEAACEEVAPPTPHSNTESLTTTSGSSASSSCKKTSEVTSATFQILSVNPSIVTF